MKKILFYVALLAIANGSARAQFQGSWTSMIGKNYGLTNQVATCTGSEIAVDPEDGSYWIAGSTTAFDTNGYYDGHAFHISGDNQGTWLYNGDSDLNFYNENGGDDYASRIYAGPSGLRALLGTGLYSNQYGQYDYTGAVYELSQSGKVQWIWTIVPPQYDGNMYPAGIVIPTHSPSNILVLMYSDAYSITSQTDVGGGGNIYFGTADRSDGTINPNGGYIITGGGPNSTGFDTPTGMIEASNGQIVISGYTSSDGGIFKRVVAGATDGFLITLTSSYQNPVSFCFGGTDSDVINQVIQGADGEYYTVGATKSRDIDKNIGGWQGGWDFWVQRLDSNFNLVWSRTFGGSGDDIAYSIAEQKGMLYAVGTSTSGIFNTEGASGRTALVLAIDTAGNIMNHTSFGGNGDNVATSVVAGTGGYVVMAGSSSSQRISAYPGGPPALLEGDTSVWITGFEFSSGVWERSFASSTTGLVFPNPAIGEFTIVPPSDANEIQRIDLLNETGDVVADVTHSAVRDANGIHIESSGLATGTYFVRLDETNGEYLYKIVINHNN